MLKFGKKITGLLSATALVSGLLIGPALAKDSSKPIVIPTHNWSSQVVMAYVIGGIFKSMGNNVKYVPADSQAVYEAIRIGDVTISHEVWQSSFGKSFQNAVDKGGVLDWGTHSAPTLEEMGVPTWVITKNLCPGLPDWKALKNCHKAFATPDSGGKGRWLEGPQSWHKDLMPVRVKALGLDDKYVVSLLVVLMHFGLNLLLQKKKVVLLSPLTGRLTLLMLKGLLLSSSRHTKTVAEKPMVVMVPVVHQKVG